MTQRPPLPPLSKNTSPRKDKTLVAQTSRPMPIRNSLHQSPRLNLYQSSSSNEYEDPIENIKEYKRLSQQISSMKMSMIPLNEELIQLQSFFGPVAIDKEAENQQQELESLIKEKEDLDAKIASVRRTYNEHNYINQQAEIAFLRSKLRRGDVILTKVETSVDKVKEERDYFLNSDTKTEIINAKKRAKELNKKLASLRKEGDSLILQYCQKLTVITEGKDNDQQQINRRKVKIRKAKHEIESRKFTLRRMKQKHDENVKDLKDRIKFKKAQKKKFDQSQNWKERTKVSFNDDGNKYNPYVTTFPVNYNQYKIVAPQDDTNPPPKEQNGADSQLNDQDSPLNAKTGQNHNDNEDETTNKLGLMYQHFPNQLNKNFDIEEETDYEEDIDDDQEQDDQQLDKPLLEGMIDKIADKLNDDNEQTTKSKKQRSNKTKQSKSKDTIHNEDGIDNEDLDVKDNDNNKENHDMDNNDEDKNNEGQQSEDEEYKNEANNNDQKDKSDLDDENQKDKKQRKVDDSKNDSQSDESSQEDNINDGSELSDGISNNEDKKDDDEISDEDSKNDSMLSDDENQDDDELDDEDSNDKDENSKDEDSGDDDHPLDKIGSNIASSLKESGNNEIKPDENGKKRK